VVTSGALAFSRVVVFAHSAHSSRRLFFNLVHFLQIFI
jgi:hypothetical protein